MTNSVKQMIAAANAAVDRLSPAEAQQMIDEGKDVLIIDVRDEPELKASGKIKNAVHVSRGMLEFRADAETPYHHPEFRQDRTILVYCASGGRSALAGKTLKDMGYDSVYNIGGFEDWQKAGLATEPLITGQQTSKTDNG